jgi:hypothetical protein
LQPITFEPLVEAWFTLAFNALIYLGLLAIGPCIFVVGWLFGREHERVRHNEKE